MGQLGSRLDSRTRRFSRRSHSSGVAPPSAHDISVKERSTPVADGARVQHVRTVGARRLRKEPWDERKYEWRAEGESWSSPEGAVTDDDSGEYETPASMIDLDRRLAETPVSVPQEVLDRRLAETPVSVPPEVLDWRLDETPVSMPPEDLDRRLADPEWYSVSSGDDDCDSPTGDNTEAGGEVCCFFFFFFLSSHFFFLVCFVALSPL